MDRAEQVNVDDWGSELELRTDLGNKRHWLAGRPVPNGTEVELKLSGRTWLRGTYEWSGIDSRWPGLRVRLDVTREPDNGRPVYAVMAMPPQSLLRWPRP
jgi:hypothetical protein